jgi:transposase
VVWGPQGKDTATCDQFFAELGADRAAKLVAVSTRSRLEPFVKLTGTVRTHRAGILAAIRLGINNARVEAFNNKVRLITRRAYGFHSAQAALALVMLACGPITLCPPHGQTLVRPPAVK